MRKFIVAVISLIGFTPSVATAGPIYFKIYDLRHKAYLSAGSYTVGGVYHMKKKASDYQDDATNWRIVPISRGADWYYIENERYPNGRLVAGNNYDGHLYFKTGDKWKSYANAQWRFTEVPDYFDVYKITDTKHGREIVAGNRFDGRVYHQYVGSRMNGRWKIKWSKGKTGGPPFFRVKLAMVNYTLHKFYAIDLESDPIILEKYVTNNLSTTFETVIEKKETVKDSVTNTTNKTVTGCHKFLLSTTLPVETSSPQNTVTTSVAVTVGHEREDCISKESGKSVSKEKTTELGFKETLKCPPKTRCVIRARYNVSRRSIPFTAVFESTFADGTVKKETITGRHKGTTYSKAVIKTLQFPGGGDR